MRASFILVVGFLLSASAARAQEKERVILDKRKIDHGSVVTVENKLRAPVTLTYDLSERINIATSAPVPLTVVIPPGKKQDLVSIRRDRAGTPWRYKHVFHWNWGSYRARHAQDVVYELPYKPGAAFEVIQGYGGTFTHKNKHAVDWAMPVGTPVTAARGGVVVDVVSHFEKGGKDPDLREKVNLVRILHKDGTLGRYVHLKKNGVVVRIGDRVKTGDVIGASGNTGYSTRPHLHFEIDTPVDGYVIGTVWARFNTTGGVVFLKADQKYTRPE